MSEFSESYHLSSNNSQDAVDLLKNTGVKGYVFPTKNGWVTFVAEGQELTPNEEIVQANHGTLLYYVCAEDHGWYFSIYQNNKRACHYECWWDDELDVQDDQLDTQVLSNVIRDHHKNSSESDSSVIEAMLHPADIDDIMDNSPAYQFADANHLPYYQWLSYIYVDKNYGTDKSLNNVVRVP